jgi:hypothetical protein
MKAEKHWVQQFTDLLEGKTIKRFRYDDSELTLETTDGLIIEVTIELEWGSMGGDPWGNLEAHSNIPVDIQPGT